MGKSPSHKKVVNTKPKWAMEQDKFARRMKYPHCKGTFPDCPETPNDSDCKLCPWFKRDI
jgi:hypothetical protein